jgi:hypothetical protein
MPVALHNSRIANTSWLVILSKYNFHLESLGSEPSNSGNEADRKLEAITG